MGHWMLGEFRFDVGEPYVILDEAKVQPHRSSWYKHRVDVVVEFSGAEYLCEYTGSAADYNKDIEPDEKEVVDCIIREIMSAYVDPAEFMAMAFMEPPEDVEFIKVIYDLLMYARDYGEELEKLLPEDWWEEEALYPHIKELEHDR